MGAWEIEAPLLEVWQGERRLEATSWDPCWAGWKLELTKDGEMAGVVGPADAQWVPFYSGMKQSPTSSSQPGQRAGSVGEGTLHRPIRVRIQVGVLLGGKPGTQENLGYDESSSQIMTPRGLAGKERKLQGEN